MWIATHFWKLLQFNVERKDFELPLGLSFFGRLLTITRNVYGHCRWFSLQKIANQKLRRSEIRKTSFSSRAQFMLREMYFVLTSDVLKRRGKRQFGEKEEPLMFKLILSVK